MSKEVATSQYAPRAPGRRARPHKAAENFFGRHVWAMAAVVLSAELLKAYVWPAVADALHTPTPQEAKIATVLNTVVDFGSDVKVRCVPGYAEETGRDGYVHGFQGFLLPLIRIDQNECDVLTRISEETRGKRTDSYAKILDALSTTLHEAVHSKLGTANEGVAVCGAIQYIGWAAMEFGMDAKDAHIVAVAGTTHRYAPRYLPRYLPPADCVPGGAYDLGIPGIPGTDYADVGYFPVYRHDLT